MLEVSAEHTPVFYSRLELPSVDFKHESLTITAQQEALGSAGYYQLAHCVCFGVIVETLNLFQARNGIDVDAVFQV